MLNKLRNQQLFLNSSETQGHRENRCPQNRQANTENHNLLSRNPGAATALRVVPRKKICGIEYIRKEKYLKSII